MPHRAQKPLEHPVKVALYKLELLRGCDYITRVEGTPLELSRDYKEAIDLLKTYSLLRLSES